ncbi:hypothetical protein AB0B18_15695 [Micromonospora chalcea]
MSYAPDDLAPLLARPTPTGNGFRQGIIRAWNPATAENTVEVDGVLIDNLPVLNTNEALLLTPGDVVGILTTGGAARSWAILGRLTIPGTPAAASALSMVSDRMIAAEIPSQGTRSAATFGDLTGTPAGPVVTATISASGKALVLVGATITTAGALWSGALMGFDITGATTRPATVTDSLEFSTGSDGFSLSASRTVLVTGLNRGEHTFTARYASSASGVPFTAENRNLVVFGL